MVFYFTSVEKDENGVPYQYYMGRDKMENEDLIKHGWPEDYWFHVDNLSSAHVYVRQSCGKTVHDIPSAVVTECSQLVKENSIEGHKKEAVDVVYTPWSNLKKTGDMVAGQVGFHNNKLVIKVKDVVKNKDAVRYLEKNKREGTMEEFIELKMKRDERMRAVEKKAKQEREKKEKAEMEEKLRQKELKSYKSLDDPNKMTSNKDTGYDSDDFM